MENTYVTSQAHAIISIVKMLKYTPKPFDFKLFNIPVSGVYVKYNQKFVKIKTFSDVLEITERLLYQTPYDYLSQNGGKRKVIAFKYYLNSGEYDGVKVKRYLVVRLDYSKKAIYLYYNMVGKKG